MDQSVISASQKYFIPVAVEQGKLLESISYSSINLVPHTAHNIQKRCEKSVETFETFETVCKYNFLF